MTTTRLRSAVVAALILAACGSTQGDLLNLPFSVGGADRNVTPGTPMVFTTPILSGSFDAGRTVDSGTADGGTADGGAADGGTADGGTADGGAADGGAADGGAADGGTINDAGPISQISNVKGGWTVTLTAAVMTAGPFYFNNATPPTQGFRDGTIVMEVASQVVVDALDPTLYTVTGGASGVSGLGEAISCEIDLFPYDGTCVDPANPICMNAMTLLVDEDPKDPDAFNDNQGNQMSGGTVAYLKGKAAQGSGTPIPFEGWITIDNAVATATLQYLPYIQRVMGASTSLNFESNSESIQFRVDPTHWFDLVDFSVFQASPLNTAYYTILQNGSYTWTDLSSFHSQLLEGFVSDESVYLFTLTGG